MHKRLLAQSLIPILSLFLLLVMPISGLAAEIQVPSQFATIQAAIDASQNGDTIVVQPGTYTENIDYNGKAIVFTSTNPLDLTIVASTIIDGNMSGSVVTFDSEETPNSILTGFTIRNGNGKLLVDGKRYGGGIYIGLQSIPTVRHNKIINNTADIGGAIYIHGNSLPTITDGPNVDYPYAGTGQTRALSVAATAGVYHIDLTVDDQHGGTATGMVSVTVIGVAIQTPVPQLIVGQSATIAATVTPVVTHSPEYPVSITWSLTGGPATGTFDAAVNGTPQATSITFTPSASGPGQIQAVYQVGAATATHSVAIALNPIALSIDLGSGKQGETIQANITGNNLGRVNAVSLSGSGVTGSIRDGKTENSLPVQFVINKEVAAGNRTIILTTPEGQFNTPVTFQINALPPITGNPTSLNLIVGNTGNITFSVPDPAPAGGLSLTLSSSAPTVATVAASATIPEGQKSIQVNITAVAYGTTTITADAPIYSKAQVPVSVMFTTGGNDSYTKSLLHMNGNDGSTTFTDNAAGGSHTWTAYGNAQLDTAQSKFGGVSGLFDGSGDYIDTPDSNDWDFGAGNFTVDGWVRLNTKKDCYIAGQDNSLGSTAATSWFIWLNSTGKISAGFVCNDGVTWRTCIGGTDLGTRNWAHIALVGDGNNLDLYINGVKDATTVDVTGKTVNNSVNKLAIGRLGEYNGYYFDGWIDEFRISKGIARWTSDFTPPTQKYEGVNHAPVAENQSVTVNQDTARAITLVATDADGDPLTYQIVAQPGHGTLSGMPPNVTYAPAAGYTGSDTFTFKANDGMVACNVATVSITVMFTTGGNDSYAKSLLHMNGNDGSTTFTDNAVGGSHIWTANGDTQIDTAQGKFGGASGYFDGDYISTPDSSDFGSGDFIIDFWMRMVRIDGSHHVIAFYGSEWSNGNYQWYFEVDENVGSSRWKLQVAVYDSSARVLISDSTLSDQTWYHVALVRNSGEVALYINGQKQSCTYNIGSNSLIDPGGTCYAKIGDAIWSNYHYYYKGWIDEFRILKGLARWTSNFTPPTQEYEEVNHAPLAQDQSVTLNQDTAKAITLVATDADGDPLTYQIVAQPGHGTLSGAPPNVPYAPAAGYYGSDTFTFKANDGMVDSNVATISISIVVSCFTPTITNFKPSAMETDGSYLYISGIGYIGALAYHRIEKRDSDGNLVDQFDQAIASPGSLSTLKLDNTNIYVGGYRTEAGVEKAIIQKRDKNNLSSQSWEYVYSGSNYEVRDLVLLGDGVYFSGAGLGGTPVMKGKLNQSDRAQVWVFTNTQTASDGISTDGSFIYVHKRTSGIATIEKVNPINGSVLGTKGYSVGNFSKGEIVDGYLYVAGSLNTLYVCAQALVEKVIPAGNSQWQTAYPTVPGGSTNVYDKAICDGSDVYVVGRAPTSAPGPTARIAKHSMSNGAEIWGVNQPTTTKTSYAGFCHLGAYLYVAGWDGDPTKQCFWLEKRNKLDGSLIWARP